MTSNPPQIATIHVHLNGSLAHTLWVALCFRFRCVLMPTVHTAIPLGTGFCFSGSVLACGFLAIGTFLHIPILAHPFGHSPWVKSLARYEGLTSETENSLHQL